MEIERIIRTLNACQLIETAFVLKQEQFQKHYYEICIEASLIIDKEESLTIIIGVPNNWQFELVDLFLKSYVGKFIPHVERDGKICLFEKEGILIDLDLNGILIQSLYRAREILLAGKYDTNKSEFIDEFELYWLQLPEHREAKLVVPEENDCLIIKSVQEQIKQRKKEKQASLYSRKHNALIYAGKDMESLKCWKFKAPCAVNSAYFVINSKVVIYPPDIRNPLSINYLNNLLSMITNEDIIRMWNKVGREKMLFFKINQPNGSENYIGFSLDEGVIQTKEEHIYIANIKHLYPIAVRRVDTNHLMKRTIENDFSVMNKKLLVIGCGSIGGYIISELCKTGFKNITIIDDDILTEENIYRHILGMEYVGDYKSIAMKKYQDRNILGNSIVSLEAKIEDAVEDGSIVLEDYDLIISATGNHNINRWINRYVYVNKIIVPIIYAWNEIYGIGNHVGYFKYGNEGCYECLFGRDEDTNEIYDRSAYCGKGQKIVKNYGCGKSFIPYGNIISQKTTIIVIEVLKEVLNGEVNKNFLVSVKGNDSTLSKMNLETSGRYKKQKDPVRRLTGNQFRKKECGVCSDCI